jgi:hypothetical protein
MVRTAIVPLILAKAAVLLGWLTARKSGSREAIGRMRGVILSGLLTLTLSLIFVIGVINQIFLYALASNPVQNFTDTRTSEQIVNRAMSTSNCSGCQSSTGKSLLDNGNGNSAQFLGEAWSAKTPESNLAPASGIKDWSDGELVSAVRGRLATAYPTQRVSFLDSSFCAALSQDRLVSCSTLGEWNDSRSWPTRPQPGVTDLRSKNRILP